MVTRDDTPRTGATRFAGVRGLGRLRRVHGSSGPVKVLAAILLVLAGFSLFTGLSALSLDGPGVGSAGAVIGWLGLHWLGLQLVLASICVAVGVYLRPFRKVAVFEHGIAVADWRTVQTWRWTEITSVSSLVRWRQRGGMEHRHTLRHTDGRTLVLTHGTQDIAEVYHAIESGATPLIIERAEDALNRGEAVAFGPITLDRQGVHTSRGTIPWAQVAGLGDAGRFVTISAANGELWPIKVARAKIVNLTALAVLVEGVIRRRSGS